jgi:hypothetical protein
MPLSDKNDLMNDAVDMCKSGELTDVHAQAIYRYLIHRMWAVESKGSNYRAHVMSGCISVRHLSRCTGVHRDTVPAKLNKLALKGLIRMYVEMDSQGRQRVIDIKLLRFGADSDSSREIDPDTDALR